MADAPKLGSSDPQAIMQWLLSRVPLYTPEWTNLSASDPGVTILQLFTDLSQQVADLCNQVPETNRRQFLSLLQVPLRPATPAQGFVCFANAKGPLQVISMAPGLQIRSGPLVYEALQGAEILPVEGQVFYKRILKGEERADTLASIYPDGQMPASVAQTVLYETAQMTPPVAGGPLPVVDLYADCADNALWIALLARSGETRSDAVPLLANRVLNLGVMPALPTSVTMSPQTTPAHRQGGRDPLTYQIFAGYGRNGNPRLVPLVSGSHVDVGAQPAMVPLRLPAEELFGVPQPSRAGVPADANAPPDLADPKLAARLVAWVRMGLDPNVHGVTAQIVWAGINAVQISQRASVSNEFLGRGTGEPNQSLTLLHAPVLADSLTVWVGNDRWEQIDDLIDAPPEVPLRTPLSVEPTATGSTPNVYTIDPVTGTITFGDGLHGARPGNKVVITASYRYGGGVAGNMEIGTINRAAALPPGVTVNNPLPTWGGTDAETTDEAEQSIPSYLRHRDRLVTADDFVEIVRRTPGLSVGRVDVLPSFHPDRPNAPSPGTVTVMVLPQTDPADPTAPTPDGRFLASVKAYVDPRRLITTEVVATGPVYRMVDVTLHFEPESEQQVASVQDSILQALRQYLSPLTGGHDGTGWPLGRAVQAKELAAMVERVDGVAFVSDLQVMIDGEGPLPAVSMDGLQLPWLSRCQALWGGGAGQEAGSLQGTPSSLILVPVRKA